MLSELIASSAERDTRFLALSGDHGYALFDAIRSRRPSQFVNVGIMEQALVGIAAGLAKTGHRPLVYGLAAFVPLRVIEQIKMDVCYSRLPVIFIGDGAGLVYSTLGSSHQCAEDVAALRPLPYIRIYAPCDEYELKASFEEATAYAGPAYIRVGKSDRLPVNTIPLSCTDSYFTHCPTSSADTCIVTMGSMTAIGHEVASENALPHVSVFRLKPLAENTLALLAPFKRLIVIEEHSRYGGLTSTLTDAFVDEGVPLPHIKVLSLQDHFAEHCGSYQYALSEHSLSDPAIRERVRGILKAQ
jgi:transketolase